MVMAPRREQHPSFWQIVEQSAQQCSVHDRVSMNDIIMIHVECSTERAGCSLALKGDLKE